MKNFKLESTNGDFFNLKDNKGKRFKKYPAKAREAAAIETMPDINTMKPTTIESAGHRNASSVKAEAPDARGILEQSSAYENAVNAATKNAAAKDIQAAGPVYPAIFPTSA